MSNQVQDYLQMLAQMPLNDRQKAFFAWQAERARSVEIRPYAANPEVERVVNRFLARFTPQLKGCYETAARCAIDCPEVAYVEGMTASLIPIGHAWNAVGDFHFDLTAEIALAGIGHNDLTDYVQVIRLNHEETCRTAVESRFYGEWVGRIYGRELDED